MKNEISDNTLIVFFDQNKYKENFFLKNTTFFGDMKLQHLSNTMRNLHYQVNPRMLDAHQRSFQRERFFQDH